MGNVLFFCINRRKRKSSPLMVIVEDDVNDVDDIGSDWRDTNEYIYLRTL